MADNDPIPLDGPTDPAGLSAALARVADGGEKKGYLGDLQTVEDYLKDFSRKVIGHVEEVERGNEKQADASAAIETLTEDAARVFTGQDPNYTPMGSWNTDGELVYSIRARFAAQMTGVPMDKPETTVKALFSLFTLGIYHAIGMLGSGASEQDIQDAVNENMRGVAYALLGIPEPE